MNAIARKIPLSEMNFTRIEFVDVLLMRFDTLRAVQRLTVPGNEAKFSLEQVAAARLQGSKC